MADKLKFEIIEELIVLSENAKGWRKELNKISCTLRTEQAFLVFLSVINV